MNLNIGLCIYCGDQAPPLSREHVLPRGLGGGDSPEGHSTALVLQKASCEKCRQITQTIEGECLRNMMDFARARLGLKRKDRRKSKMKAFLDLPDGSREERYIESNDILGPVVLPSFYEAGALTDKPFSATFGCKRDLKVIVVAPARGEMLNYSRIGVELHCTAM